MSFDHQHRGSSIPGLLSPQHDRRVSDLAQRAQQYDVVGQAPYQAISDPFRVAASQQQQLKQVNPLSVGTVIHALPHFNWYKVQMGNGAGWISACHLRNDTAHVPLAPQAGGAIPPGSSVLVHLAPGSTTGIILGVIPFLIDAANDAVLPGWLSQRGATGFQRERAHQFLLTGLGRQGILNFSSQSPLDSTAFEWSRITDTGLAILLDSFQVFMRVNEACGLFLNLWDSHCRLAGVQLDIHSFFHELEARLDEGETRLVERVAIYPWEAMGALNPGEIAAAAFSAQESQYGGIRGTQDLPEGSEGRQGIFRVQRHDGYLGQGGLRTVSIPGEDLDLGVLEESIGLDGSYALRSAKSLVIGKRVSIPIAREIVRPEDGGGDDRRAGNYAFSGIGETPHRVGEPFLTGEVLSMRRVAAIQDYLTYLYNWKAQHPFHYHQGDYSLADEGEDTVFTAVQDSIDFGELSSRSFLSDPDPIPVEVDHRYGAVPFFQRESADVWHEDGSRTIDDGYGARITLSGGKIRIESAGDIEFVSGSRILLIGREVVAKAAGSIDITCNEDLRLKSEHNLQAHSAGGILLEARGEDVVHNYHNLIGTDVVSAGIVLKSAGQTGILARDIYLRSGINGSGDITLDGGEEKENALNLHFERVNAFTISGMDLWCAPVPGEVELSHRFSNEGVLLGGPVAIDGDLAIVREGDLRVAGDIDALGDISAGERLASKDGGEVDEIDGQFASNLEVELLEDEVAFDEHRTSGDASQVRLVDEVWYGEFSLGNQQVLEDLGFSFRDDDQGLQYRTTGLIFTEPRWQQMVRLGGGSGGEQFVENPVVYQGRELYPWPGRRLWIDGPGEIVEGYLQLESLSLFDASEGKAFPRLSLDYENPGIADWLAVPMFGSFLIVP